MLGSVVGTGGRGAAWGRPTVCPEAFNGLVLGEGSGGARHERGAQICRQTCSDAAKTYENKPG